jgi:hypothetical protein
MRTAVVRAFNSHHRMAALFAEDGDAINPDGRVVKGGSPGNAVCPTDGGHATRTQERLQSTVWRASRQLPSG